MPERDCASLLRALRNDPSLRFSDAGRQLLRWLDSRVGGLGELEALLATVPPHCRYTVASLVKKSAGDWLAFASKLEQRVDLQ
jgi:hypothetical protein